MRTSDKQPGSSKSANVSTNISVINHQLNVRPFQTMQNRTETVTRWEKWLKNIERQFHYFWITEPEIEEGWVNNLWRTNNSRFRRYTS